MDFNKKLEMVVRTNQSLLCIGLDSDINLLPAAVAGSRFPQFEFNRRIIAATFDEVCAYKPNTAFYEARGEAGIAELKMTCDYLVAHHPNIPIILDAKRGDIGNTNTGYVQFAFDYLQADAVTIQPYLGREALQPFLERKDKGTIVLCRTSNPGAGEFQDLVAGGEPLYLKVARRVALEWNGNKNCLLVVGATAPYELKKVRTIAGDIRILVPGVGVQGGDLEAVLKNGLTADKKGLIITVSRSVIFSERGPEFATAAQTVAARIKARINDIISQIN